MRGTFSSYADEGDGHDLNVRQLMDRIRRERWTVFSDEPNHLGMQPVIYPPNPVRDGLRRNRDLFLALLKDDSEMSEQDKQRILDADPRMGFQMPDDWQGAARALKELGNLE